MVNQLVNSGHCSLNQETKPNQRTWGSSQSHSWFCRGTLTSCWLTVAIKFQSNRERPVTIVTLCHLCLYGAEESEKSCWLSSVPALSVSSVPAFTGCTFVFRCMRKWMRGVGSFRRPNVPREPPVDNHSGCGLGKVMHLTIDESVSILSPSSRQDSE